MRNTVIIIPVYNEAANISRVVHEIRAHAPQAKVVVIDDGSVDGSAEVVRSTGSSVIVLPHNLGIGGAVQTGYRYAVSRGYSKVARIDGDGQHIASYIDHLLKPLEAGQADVVIGSRFTYGRGYTASLSRALGIHFFTLLVSLATGERFSDPTSGFQACNQAAARFLAEYLPSDYPEIEGLVLLCRAGFRVMEVPVEMRPRYAGRSSIRPLRAFYYMLKVTLAVLFGMLRPRLPRESDRCNR